MQLRWWTWLVVALMASWATASPAEDPPEEPPKDDAVLEQACTDSYVKAQELRKDTRLIEALDLLRVCVDEACPEFMREHCGMWIDEVEKAMPTVVPELVDEDGRARNDVRVTVDERLLTERLDGRPRRSTPASTCSSSSPPVANR